jgi:hypothetical protein
MQIRQTVMQVLNPLLQPHLEEDAPKTYRTLGAHLRHMRAQWVDQRPLTYTSLARRLAFLCAHVPVNAEVLAWIMHKLNNASILRVWALGGGPGTELLSVYRQMERANANLNVVAQGAPKPRIEFSACDREAGWTLIFDGIRQQVLTVHANDAAQRRFQLDPVPTLIISGQATVPAGDPPDLYLMSYVLSENNTGLVESLQPVVATAPDDALFVLVDVLGVNVAPRIAGKKFLTDLGLHILWPRPFPAGAGDSYYQFNMRMQANVAVMEPHYTGIKEHYAGWELRQNSDVFWLVASKTEAHPDFIVV